MAKKALSLLTSSGGMKIDKLSPKAVAGEAKVILTPPYLRLKNQIDKFVERAQELREAADGMREEYPPIIQEKVGELLGYLRMADGYAWALGVDYDLDADDNRIMFPPPNEAEQLYRAGRFIQDREDAIPDWIYKRLRSETKDALRSWKDFSDSTYAALDAALSVPYAIIDLYDVATDTVDKAQDLSDMTAKNAAARLCTDYLQGSAYRRMKMPRVPGQRADWKEVCDFWAENDTEPFGESFYWPRPEDPLYVSRPPYSLRKGKKIVEEGCLPGEICPYAPTLGRYGFYKSDRLNMREEIQSVLDVPDRIQAVIDGREMTDLLGSLDTLLDRAKTLLNTLKSKLDEIKWVLTRRGVRAAMIVITSIYVGPAILIKGHNTARRAVIMKEEFGKKAGTKNHKWKDVPFWRKRTPALASSDYEYDLARAKAETWSAGEAHDEMVIGLGSAIDSINEALGVISEIKPELPVYRQYWRGTVRGHPSYQWRTRIAPYMTRAKNAAAHIDTLINGALWQDLCDEEFPIGGTTWSRRESYWKRQGVPDRCFKYITGSYTPTPNVNFPDQRPGGQGPFIPGGGSTATPPITAFGAVAPPEQGLQTWQKVAIVGVALWLVTRSK